MKKLIFYDHLGQKVFDKDVFLEGSDFRHIFSEPKAIWFGEVCIVDKEPELAPVAAELAGEEAKLIETETRVEKVKEIEQAVAEVNGKIEEGKVMEGDTKATGDKGIGNLRAGKKVQSPSSKAKAKHNTSRAARSRDKRL